MLRRAGISTATLYRGFDSKEGLVAAALERRQRAWIEVRDAAIARSRTDEERVLAVFDALDEFRARPTGSRWCAFLGAAAEYADAPPEIAAAVQADTDAFRTRLSALVAPLVDDPDALADQLLLVITGDLAMRLRRPTHPTSTARAIASALLAQASR
ncbi:hypothetical protein GCM10010921_04760 [Microbacterium album]|uniref:HTH tetR-type domain-containing protein n=1 Tax=Microbacterium album TaxID=2053191 RepID=A0A917MKG3_9MICO|nr:hypothetical protein GCM10010921_04760 [Microbacterium album]